MNYIVTLSREKIQVVDIEVEAKTKDEAEEIALADTIADIDWDTVDTMKTFVDSVEEVK